jgi:uncharacterized protein (DUF1697 family)
MAELSRLFEALGFKEVETFIASGNVVFTSPARDLAALERRIEAQLHESLGFEVKTFLRTAAEVEAIARYEPFPAAQRESAQALNVGFLAQPLSAEAGKALTALKTAIDDFHLNGREVYWLCRKRQSESDFSNMVFERAVKVRTTFRGVKTVAKLAAKLAGS